MRSIDHLFEKSSRALAQRTSRRSLLGMLGQVLTGAALIPLLPIDRSARAAEASTSPAKPKAAKPASDDPQSCDYWKYCAVDGFLCACCGGSSNSCPPGTTPSPITWIGTCHNPGDDRDYIISYNDCCGKSSCGRCFCNRNEGDTPLYQPGKSNDYNWCSGNSEANIPYHCSTGRIVSVVG
jgi:methylamine dehydrogenase light chain